MVSNVTSKEIVRRIFSQTESPRIPFIPLVCTYAAKLEQISVRKMLTDPTQLAKAIQNAQTLFGYDGVINVLDPSLEAEVCGCPVTWKDEDELPSISAPIGGYDKIAQLDISGIEKKGRLPVVLEATRRLKIVLGRTVIVAGVITGPLKLASYLIGSSIIRELEEKPEEARKVIDFAGQVTTKVCKAYCELEPDIIVLADDMLPQFPLEKFPIFFPVVRPILNIVSFYNAWLILMTKECPPEKLDILFKLGVSGVVIDMEGDFSVVKKRASEQGIVIGGALPFSILNAESEYLEQYIRACLEKVGNKGFFLTTKWEIPTAIPPENIHKIMKVITNTNVVSNIT